MPANGFSCRSNGWSMGHWRWNSSRVFYWDLFLFFFGEVFFSSVANSWTISLFFFYFTGRRCRSMISLFSGLWLLLFLFIIMIMIMIIVLIVMIMKCWGGKKKKSKKFVDGGVPVRSFRTRRDVDRFPVAVFLLFPHVSVLFLIWHDHQRSFFFCSFLFFFLCLFRSPISARKIIIVTIKKKRKRLREKRKEETYEEIETNRKKSFEFRSFITHQRIVDFNVMVRFLFFLWYNNKKKTINELVSSIFASRNKKTTRFKVEIRLGVNWWMLDCCCCCCCCSNRRRRARWRGHSWNNSTVRFII